jgi:hypothetical protein
VLCDTPSIRDVIAFPKNGSGVDPVFRSPNSIPEGQLEEYGLVYNQPTLSTPSQRSKIDGAGNADSAAGTI